tara:strand:- start:204 stop:482 length:279 start_codon:yes stop_codon:yes gene_type:complete
MKKVLCGLVIALMMTGDVYAELDRDECKYLKINAEFNVNIAINFNESSKKEADRLARENSNDLSILNSMVQKELDEIKKAHYYAVTWSALCD